MSAIDWQLALELLIDFPADGLGVLASKPEYNCGLDGGVLWYQARLYAGIIDNASCGLQPLYEGPCVFVNEGIPGVVKEGSICVQNLIGCWDATISSRKGGALILADVAKLGL